jgi:hypothetical protein
VGPHGAHRTDFTKTKIARGYYKGVSVYDLPLNLWPKFMTVTSRTDLQLEKPAAKGYPLYKKKDFLSTIENIFS